MMVVHGVGSPGTKGEVAACSNCDSAFSSKSDLRKHFRSVHEKERRYSCDSCESAFFFRKDLRKHSEIVHEKRRPFACGECGWRAGKKEHLKRHVRLIHERRRPFMCTVCSVSFGTKQNYQEHTKTLAHRRTMMAGGEPPGVGFGGPGGGGGLGGGGGARRRTGLRARPVGAGGVDARSVPVQPVARGGARLGAVCVELGRAWWDGSASHFC
ncbi:hypothetical protein BU14_0500s0013 [Porphyra umbilicalis]|uniref:C2H2-type domain-containing protein n=1 Tax=Porphyra umbilicalis TaxID=2786 RepID=A0A1X6NT79_PORUM|nr:hypothetical protein BU14_0500s0013 [Porphyra umbilicalis]|eukprot:OSX71814.1 hypothetical protein BU14_0500s0013 [Porphyra umbilicalis]